MKITQEQLKRAVNSVVQPLYRGTFNGVNKLFATLKDLAPFGNAENNQMASPFGLISKPIKGTYAYFQNLNGNSQAPIIVNHLDLNRPEPSAEGETILYSLNPDGSLVPVKFVLGNDGNLMITPAAGMTVTSPAVKFVSSSIKLGSASSAQPVPLGTVLSSLLDQMCEALSNTEQQIAQIQVLGNLGFPTSIPINAALFMQIKLSVDNLRTSPIADNAILSGKAFTEK